MPNSWAHAHEVWGVSEAESFYVAERGGYVGTILSQGAWDPGSQTGVAVLALLGHVLEDVPTLVPMSLARIGVDLVRPVPIGKRLAIAVNTVREGKKLQVVDLVVTEGDTEHVRARVLRLRDADLRDVPGMPPSSTDEDPAAALPPADSVPRLVHPQGPAMMRAVDLRRVAAGSEGRWAYWLRLTVPVVAGEPIRPTSIQTVGVDFTNCIGSDIDPSVATTINPDVTGQFLRQPVGEWIGITGDTRFDHGVARGFSVATLSDAHGVFAAALSSQLVQPVRT